jgi:phosphatidylglycerol:prolipoprotein diacylglycerol transferase
VNAGLILGGLLVVCRARQRGVSARPVVDGALAAALVGLILARAAYVAVHWDYYGSHLGQAAQPWDGGLLWQGALVGGLIGAVLVSTLRDVELLRLLDLLTPGAAILAVFAWLACFAIGCAAGIESYPHQRLLWTLSLDLPNLYGIREPRVAVQLLGATWSGVLLAGVLGLHSCRWRNGVLFSLWLTLHSSGSLALGFLRADPMALIHEWRVDQLANLVLTLVGAGLLAGRLSRTGNRDTGRTSEHQG